MSFLKGFGAAILENAADSAAKKRQAAGNALDKHGDRMSSEQRERAERIAKTDAPEVAREWAKKLRGND